MESDYLKGIKEDLEYLRGRVDTLHEGIEDKFVRKDTFHLHNNLLYIILTGIAGFFGWDKLH